MSINIPLITQFSLLFVSLSSYSMSAQAINNDGRLLAAQCAQCHGTDGYSQTDIDSLAGEKDIAEELKEMRLEKDADDIMAKHAHGYTDAEINLISEYFASLPEQQAGQTDSTISTEESLDHEGDGKKDDGDDDEKDDDD